MSFNWNKKRTVQQLTPNKVIVNLEMSPKEVIELGGNRIDQGQVLASICVAVKELISIQEQSAARIESLLSTRGPVSERVEVEDPTVDPADRNPT